MSQSYTPEFKKKIVRLHLEEECTYKSITPEYGVPKARISKCCAEFSKQCLSMPDVKAECDNMKGLLKLKRENEERHKENLFLIKRSRILCKGNGLEIHRFSEQSHKLFGMRWLFRRICICSNAYNN